MACHGIEQPPVAGDVKVSVYTSHGKLCQFWFHTAFVEGSCLSLSKQELDKAGKNKRLAPDFGVELSFARPASVRDEELARSEMRSRAETAESSRCNEERNAPEGAAGGSSQAVDGSGVEDDDEDEDDEDDDEFEAAPTASGSTVGRTAADAGLATVS